MKQMKKTNQFVMRIMSLLLAMALLISGIRPITVKAAETNIAVETINFKDFSNWRSGIYDWTNGRYRTFESRVCLNDYVTASGEKYRVCVNNNNYHLLVRELDKNKNFINSFDFVNGTVYSPSANTYYLGISIYKATGEKGITYATYAQLFANGFYAGLEAIRNEETSATTPSDSNENEDNKTESDITENNSTVIEDKIYDVAKINYKDFSNWRSGLYHWTSGNYCTYPTRICLNNYVSIDGGAYQACVKNTGYHLLIRELDKNKELIKSYNLADGQSYTPSTNAAYLGISIYKLSGESSVSYNTFKTLFANGFYAGLEVVEEVEEEEEQILDSSNSDELDNGTVKDSNTLQEELIQMLETGDMTKHDISRYNKNFSEVYLLYDNVIKNDCYLAYQTTYDVVLRTSKNASGKIETIYFGNMDSDFPTRYAGMKKVVKDALSGIDESMLDVEKALVLHDYVVEHTSYVSSATGNNTASGCLVSGKAICSGYARGLMVLLHEAGIETYYISGNSGSHGWLMAKLDGQWYHIDPTWDDTRSRKSGYTDHTYFVRNDDQFQNSSYSKHTDWVSYEFDATSTSTLYNNWFVHDVVGKILYKDGFWYYADGNKLMKSKINGTQMVTVVVENSTVTLVSLDNTGITYQVNGQQKTIK